MHIVIYRLQLLFPDLCLLEIRVVVCFGKTGHFAAAFRTGPGRLAPPADNAIANNGAPAHPDERKNKPGNRKNNAREYNLPRFQKTANRETD